MANCGYAQVQAGDAGHHTVAQPPRRLGRQRPYRSLVPHLQVHAGYPPNGFEDIERARQWVLKFVTWYNGEHLHSGLSFVTTEQRHSGLADDVLRQRREVYAQARERHPLGWKRPPHAWQVADEVWLNPPSKLDQRRAA